MVSIAYGLDASGNAGSALNQLLGTVNYGYTNRGNIASIATTGASANCTRTFEYDVLERLKTVAGQVGRFPVTVTELNMRCRVDDERGLSLAAHTNPFHP